MTQNSSVFFLSNSVFLLGRTLVRLHLLRPSVLQQILCLNINSSVRRTRSPRSGLTKYWMGSEGLLVLTALRAGRRWGTTSWSRYCLLVRLLISGILLGFFASGSSPAMTSGLKYCHVACAVELRHQDYLKSQISGIVQPDLWIQWRAAQIPHFTEVSSPWKYERSDLVRRN